MSSKRKRPPKRAEGQSQISVSVPTWLVEEIDALAKEERRSRSNFIVSEMEKIVSRKNAQKKLSSEESNDAHAERYRSSDSTVASRRIFPEQEKGSIGREVAPPRPSERFPTSSTKSKTE